MLEHHEKLRASLQEFLSWHGAIAILPQPSRILTEQVLAAGFSGLIEKPFDAMQLIEMIRSI